MRQAAARGSLLAVAQRLWQIKAIASGARLCYSGDGSFSMHCLKTRTEDDIAYIVGISVDGSLAVQLKPLHRERIEIEIEMLDGALGLAAWTVTYSRGFYYRDSMWCRVVHLLVLDTVT